MYTHCATLIPTLSIWATYEFVVNLQLRIKLMIEISQNELNLMF